MNIKKEENMKVKKRSNGDVTICMKPDGKYEMRISVGTDTITGNPRRKSFSGKTVDEVKSQMQKWNNQEL